MSTEDQQVIERRLMINGQGFGDDNRLNLLQKSICRWAKIENTSPSKNVCFQNYILSILAQCESEMKMSVLVQRRIQRDKLHYLRLLRELEQGIEEIRQIMSACKSNIDNLHKHLEKVDKTVKPILKKIRKYPKVATYMKMTKDLQKEIVTLEDTFNKLREKRLSVIMHLFVFEKTLASSSHN